MDRAFSVRADDWEVRRRRGTETPSPCFAGGYGFARALHVQCTCFAHAMQLRRTCFAPPEVEVEVEVEVKHARILRAKCCAGHFIDEKKSSVQHSITY